MYKLHTWPCPTLPILSGPGMLTPYRDAVSNVSSVDLDPPALAQRDSIVSALGAKPDHAAVDNGGVGPLSFAKLLERLQLPR